MTDQLKEQLWQDIKKLREEKYLLLQKMNVLVKLFTGNIEQINELEKNLSELKDCLTSLDVIEKEINVYPPDNEPANDAQLQILIGEVKNLQNHFIKIQTDIAKIVNNIIQALEESEDELSDAEIKKIINCLANNIPPIANEITEDIIITTPWLKLSSNSKLPSKSKNVCKYRNAYIIYWITNFLIF